MPAFIRLASLAAAVIALSSCMYFGPDSVRSTRPEYNIAIQQTNEQELLLNLVRLRYRDSLYFLSVEKVASSVEFTRGIGASAEIPERGWNKYTVGGAAVAMAEKPTIFYTPLEGERFSRQMMSIVNPDIYVLLANSGWSIERLMAVSLQEMNGLKNAPTAAGPTPSYEPVYQEFQQALRLLRTLQIRKEIEFGRVAFGNDAHLELRFLPQAANDPDAKEFKRLLGLKPEYSQFRVVLGLGQGEADTINVVPRSLIGVLNYLSQGVAPPERHLVAGKVTRTLTEAGESFDWQAVLGGLFSVNSATSKPDDAAVAVNYRDHWFYIRDNDLESKSTFSLLTQLFALQAGPQGGTATPITFSIGGR